MPDACHNCGSTLQGPFCSTCGQEDRPVDPTLLELTQDIVQELVDVDGRLVRSIRALFLAPGLLTRELFLGRRVPWVTPLRLYLTFSVVLFAVVAMGGSEIEVHVKGDDRAAAARLKSLGFASEEQMRDTLVRAQAVWMPRVNFLLVPLFAGLVALVRRGSGRRYPQHLLFALHAHAAWFGVRAIAAAGMLISPAGVGKVLSGLSLLYGVAYLVIAFRVAYDVPTRRAIGDTVIVLGIYGACVVAATVGIALPVLFWRA